MSRSPRIKRMRWWAATLLLPSFLLRVLIPVGFMPMIGPDHGVRLVVCDSYAPVPWTTSPGSMNHTPMPMDAGMDMSQDHPMDGMAGGGPPVHQDHGSCPYGSSPALGALPTLAVLPILVPHSIEQPAAASEVAQFEVSPRAHFPRGPPA